MSYHLFIINKELRTTLQEMQAFLGVAFNQAEVKRIFSDAENDQVSYKTYILYKDSHLLFGDWLVEGIVEEYEPETIILQIKGRSSKRKKFEAFLIEHGYICPLL